MLPIIGRRDVAFTKKGPQTQNGASIHEFPNSQSWVTPEDRGKNAPTVFKSNITTVEREYMTLKAMAADVDDRDRIAKDW